jgi:hypothetical protein
VTDADATASLIGQLTQGYREHKAEVAEPKIIAVSGLVLGTDIEDQADALAEGAGRLADLLLAFAQEPGPRSIDAIAVFHGLSRTAESMATAAAELRRQGWPVLEDDAEPEANTAWCDALEGLKVAARTFEWVAPGWI